jgi:hypothetical protein
MRTIVAQIVKSDKSAASAHLRQWRAMKPSALMLSSFGQYRSPA